MKIIATTAYGFLVEATKDELSQVMGFNSEYQFDRAGNKFAIGKDVQVSKLYDALGVCRSRKTEIENLANALRKVAGRVDTINQALAAPIVEVEVKG